MSLLRSVVAFACVLSAWCSFTSGAAAQDIIGVTSAAYPYAFKLNGEDATPPLTLVRGRSYTFNVAVSSAHPFFIKDALGAQAVGAYASVTPAQPDAGTINGTLYLTVPTNAPDTLYYQCREHYGMNGTFAVVNPPPAANGQPCTADSQCVSQICHGSTCRASVGGACSSTVLCASDLLCSANLCVPTNVAAGGTCSVTAQCAADLTCQSGTCRRNLGGACGSGVLCVSGLTCSSGTCRSGLGGVCNNTDSLCVSGNCGGSYCCAASCTAAGQCFGDPTCTASGQCVPQPLGQGAPCNDNQSCTVGDTCNGSGTCGGTVSCNDPVAAGCADVATGACGAGGVCEYDGEAPPGATCSVAGSSGTCQGGACVPQVSDGTGFVWGRGDVGQLGNGQAGTSIQSATPIAIRDGSDNLFITQLAHGAEHTLALTSDGAVWAWGNNTHGQIGDGTTARRTTPVKVITGSIVSIAAAPFASYAIGANGTLTAWGRNASGELGDPTFTGSASMWPRTLTAHKNVIAVAPAGTRVDPLVAHVVALRADGSLIAWGSNSHGQLGINVAASATLERTPRAVVQPLYAPNPTTRYRAVAAGAHHSVAIASDGNVYAWGSGSSGATGTTVTTLRPTKIPTTLYARAIAAGAAHTLAIDQHGNVYAWGGNQQGQLGLGGYDSGIRGATQVPRLSNAIAIAASDNNSAAVLADGTLWTWGNNGYGQLGDANRRASNGTLIDGTPQPVAGLSDARGVALGPWHASTWRPLNALYAWGSNNGGLLGNDQTQPQLPFFAGAIAVDLPDTVQTIKAISAGVCGTHNLLLAGDGTVYSWGTNTYGELGVAGSGSAKPTRVHGLPPIVAISAGCYVSAALAADGTVWTWGFGGYGTLGDGTNTNATTPRRVPQAYGVIALHMRGLTLGTLSVTGNAILWGYNGYQQLGVAGDSRSTPGAYLPMPGGRSVRSLALGVFNAFAVLDDGTVASWGYNYSGSLGLNTTAVGPFTPSLVKSRTGSATLTQVASLFVGAHNTAARAFNLPYSVYLVGWGASGAGELGLPSSDPLSYPTLMPIVGREITFAQGASYALMAAGGGVQATGNGASGALGDDTTTVRAGWAPIPNLADVAALEGGTSLGLAILPGPARAGGIPTIVQCAPRVALVGPTPSGPGNTCFIHPTTSATSGVLLRGDVLAPDRVYRRGEVLIAADGTIACVGCDCSASTSYAQAARIDCPRGAISPGLINTHEHLSCRTTGDNSGHGLFDFRDDWRDPDDDGPEVSALLHTCDVSEDPMQAARELEDAEMRHVVSGTTSVIGGATSVAAGLLRNLDVIYPTLPLNAADPREGIKARVVSNTFPLNDHFFTAAPNGACPGSTPNRVYGADQEVFHLGEGVDERADRELTCGISGMRNSVYRDQTTLVHAIAIQPTQAQHLSVQHAWVSWSPRSNLDLYGVTTPVTMLDRMGVGIALGTDWEVTGSTNLTRELACAAQYNRERLGGYFSDQRLWQMVTGNAAFAAGVQQRLGALRVGAVADIAVFDATIHPLHSAVVRGNPGSVALTLRGGRAIYGDASMFEDANSPWHTDVDQCHPAAMCGVTKRACGRAPLGDMQCGTATNEPSCEAGRDAFGPITQMDRDGDGVEDDADNCPRVFNPGVIATNWLQRNADGDQLGDACDRCPTMLGEACTNSGDDIDGDSATNSLDNCAFTANPTQTDVDSDGIGDECDCTTTTCLMDIAVARDEEAMGYPGDGARVRVGPLYVTAVRAGLGFFAQANPNRLPVPPSSRMSDPAHPGNYGNLGIYVYFGSAPTGTVLSTGVTSPIEVGDQAMITGTLYHHGELNELITPSVSILSRSATLPFAALARPGTALSTYTPAGSLTTGKLASAFESAWMRVDNVQTTVINPDAPAEFYEWEALHATKAAWPHGLRIDDYLFTYTPQQLATFRTLGREYTSISGVLIHTFAHSKLAPRSASEIVLKP